MRKLKLKDKKLFDEFLSIDMHNLSYFSFVNIFIWKELFDIFWQIIDGNLCIFAKDSAGCFMYLPPLGNGRKQQVLSRCFRVMDRINKDSSISRIENIEAGDVDFYGSLGLKCRLKHKEYIYRTQDLMGLKGNRYKHKRASYNFFTKNYDFKYELFNDNHKKRCFALYDSWVKSRCLTNQDSVYRQMLNDNYHTTSLALEFHEELTLEGRVVTIEDKIKGYSFGFRLNHETYCILFEITDLRIKGLAQYLFKEVSAGKNKFSYINAMDDSGLDNLKKVKLSYRPHRFEPSYIAGRN